MKFSDKNFLAAIAFGLVIGLSFTVSAFSEPTSLPANTISYPPINVGAETQIREGSLGIGDGVSQASSTLTSANSLYISKNLSADAVNVRKNATLVGNVNVGGRSIIAGALRAGQVVVSNTTSSTPTYDSTGEKLFFPNGTTTNLLRGNTCTIGSSATCPPGTVLVSYNTNGSGVCRYINPGTGSFGSTGSCSNVSYPSVSVSLTNTTNNSNACQATRSYSASGSGTVYWQIKGINDTDWTYFGTGATTQVVVGMGGSITKAYELRATIVNNGLTGTDTEDVYTVVDTTCSSQSGGSTGGTGQ